MIDRFDYTKKRLAENASIRQIARELSVDHTAIQYWIKHNFTTGTRNTETTKNDIITVCQSNPAEYAYLLGSYFGDGYIVQFKRTKKLTFYCFSEYREIIDLQKLCVSKLFSNNIIGEYKQLKAKCVEVRVHHKNMEYYFPQHGVGRKSERPIVLEQWQQDIVDCHRDCFIAGLIDTDGSHYFGKASKRWHYQFTNKSKDIMDLFVESINKFDIHNYHLRFRTGTDILNVTISKTTDVAKLDEIYKTAYTKLNQPIT